MLTDVPIDFWARLPEPWKLPPLRINEQQPAHKVKLPVLARRGVAIVLAQMILEHGERFLLTEAAQGVNRANHITAAIRVSIDGRCLAQEGDGVCVEGEDCRARERQTAQHSTNHF
jgi:hypothetical protein